MKYSIQHLIKEREIAVMAVTSFFLICLFITFNYEGTGDSGDSISHFLYAEYAFQHPENFFFQWAKPFFVLFAAPFAHFGFVGIKIFNSLNASLTLFFTYKIAKKLQLPNAGLVLLILATCSTYFTLIFSGLTEHFSALLLVIAIYLFLNEKYIPATIIISFLPFVRSEGLLIIGVTAFYLLSKKAYKYWLLLPYGHILYSIAGYSVHKNFLWVFNKISYLSWSAYGSGSPFHFVEQLYYASGLPQYVFFFVGLIYFLLFLIKNKLSVRMELYEKYPEIMYLIFGYFGILVIAHSVFWYLGIFNSYGLPRVMNTVMPLFSIIVLLGFNYALNFIDNINLKMSVKWFMISIMMIMPFTNNPAAIHFPRDFVKPADQILLRDVTQYLSQDFKGYTVFYSNPCVSYYLEIDPFDTQQSQWLYKINEIDIPKNSIIIWDNLFSVIDHGFSLEKIQADDRFEEVKQFENKTTNNHFVLFRKRN